VKEYLATLNDAAFGAAIVHWGCSIRLELADACSKKLIV
jgi:hypothetical protein